MLLATLLCILFWRLHSLAYLARVDVKSRLTCSPASWNCIGESTLQYHARNPRPKSQTRYILRHVSSLCVPRTAELNQHRRQVVTMHRDPVLLWHLRLQVRHVQLGILIFSSFNLHCCLGVCCRKLEEVINQSQSHNLFSCTRISGARAQPILSG